MFCATMINAQINKGDLVGGYFTSDKNQKYYEAAVISVSGSQFEAKFTHSSSIYTFTIPTYNGKAYISDVISKTAGTFGVGSKFAFVIKPGAGTSYLSSSSGSSSSTATTTNNSGGNTDVKSNQTVSATFLKDSKTYTGTVLENDGSTVKVRFTHSGSVYTFVKSGSNYKVVAKTAGSYEVGSLANITIIGGAKTKTTSAPTSTQNADGKQTIMVKMMYNFEMSVLEAADYSIDGVYKGKLNFNGGVATINTDVSSGEHLIQIKFKANVVATRDEKIKNELLRKIKNYKSSNVMYFEANGTFEIDGNKSIVLIGTPNTAKSQKTIQFSEGGELKSTSGIELGLDEVAKISGGYEMSVNAEVGYSRTYDLETIIKGEHGLCSMTLSQSKK